MKINKRIIRNIGHNRSFYISSILLTVFTVSFLIASISTGDTLNNTMDEFLKGTKVEQGKYYTAVPMNSDDIRDVEDKYNVTIEEQKYIESGENDKTVRVFQKTEKVNRYVVTEGQDADGADEILLTENFAKENGYDIGDSIEIEGDEYRITGYCIRGDYVYMLENGQETYVNNKGFGLAIVSKEAFDKFDNPGLYYSIRYGEDNAQEVRKCLHDEYDMTSYTADYANTRIKYTEVQGENYSSMGVMISAVLFVLIMLIITLTLGRTLKREQKQIGVLMALGYRKREIAAHYMKFAAVPGIAGSLLGIAAGIPFARGYTYMTFTDFEPVPYEMAYNTASMLAGLLIPTVLYVLTAYFVVMKMLRNPSKELLRGNVGLNLSKMKKALSHSNIRARTKFKIRGLLLNPGRTIIACLGLMIAGTSLIAGFVMKDSCEYIIEKGLENAGSYQYQYYFTSPRSEEIEDGEPFVSGTFEVEGSDVSFGLSGIEEDSKFVNLNTVSGNDAEYGGYYMTMAAATTYGVEAGDKFTFFNPATMEKTTVTVSDIIDDNTQVALYTSLDNAAEILGLDAGFYTAVMSDRELDYPESEILSERSKDSMRTSLENYLGPVMMVMYILIILGIAIGFTVTYLTVNMIIEENRYTITMLKILGFRKKEINGMLLNMNHILVPIGFLLSIPFGLAICTAALADTVESFSMYIEAHIAPMSLLICLVLLCFAYFASLSVLKGKVTRVNMVSELKERTE